MKIKKQLGFTLSEVLITLTVIGVVIALTIPSLVSDTSEKALHTQWKKQYRNIEEAVLKTADNGDLDVSTHVLLRDSIKSVMISPAKEGLWENLSNAQYYYYTNSSSSASYPAAASGATAVTSNDGTVWMFFSYLEDQSLSGCTHTIGSLSNVCAAINIDVNGSKSPNMYGKDFHQALIVRQNNEYIVYPKGAVDGLTCVAGSVSDLTSACSAYVLTRTPDEMP